MSTRPLLTALLAAAITLPIMAQSDAVPPAQSEATIVSAPDAPLESARVVSAVASRDKDTLSVDFPDEDIKTILRNVADLFELNLVVPDTVTGKTTIKMHDVTWRQIFHNILAPINYTYVEDGNIIKIVSNETLQAEPGTTEVFILNNAKAAEIKPTIDGLIDAAAGGRIVIDGRSNALVITERPSRMNRIRVIIEQLDKATEQVMIESKFVEVTDRDIRNIGVNWAGLSEFKLNAGELTQEFTRGRGQDSSNKVTSDVGGGDTVTYVTGFNAPIPSTTSLPDGKVTLPSSTPSTTTLAGTGENRTASTTYNGTDILTRLADLTNTGSTGRLTNAVFSASDFGVVLSALKTQNNTKIVSNPTIVTLNNTEAVLNLGQEYPIPNYTYNEQQGRFDVSGFTYKPIGIILKVTPQVNAQGIIKLNLEPEVSQRNGDSSFGGANIPIIATRKAKTQVQLKDGYTMGIGGLITSSTNHGGTKVPVLGNIPVLGRLFSSKSVNDEATNLLIFITAKTVTSDGAAPEEVFDPRAIKAVGMTQEDLPGYRAAKGSDLFAPAPSSEK